MYFLNKLKARTKSILNIATYFLLIFRAKIALKGNLSKVAVFADYLDVSFLLSADSLKNESIILFCTKRYPFFQLLMNKVLSKIDMLIVVEDFSEKQYQFLLNKCKSNNVKVVLIQSGDFLVPAYNYINQKIGDKGNSDLAVNCSLDKGVMRKILNENNISRIKTVNLNNKDDIAKVDFYPCVLKPKIGTASEGVILLESESDFDKFLVEAERQRRKTEFDTGYIIEEYIEGRQFDVEGFIDNGKLIILSIVEENYTGFFPYFNINWFFFNAYISSEFYHKIYDAVQKAFLSCGLLHGAYHCELRIDNNDNVRILEFSNRMGGGFEKPISDVSGNHFAELYALSMLGKLNKTEFININKHLLQKYFQSESEFIEWKIFLDKEKVTYSYSNLNYRGHIGVINIYGNDELMKKIGTKFNLIYVNEL